MDLIDNCAQTIIFDQIQNFEIEMAVEMKPKINNCLAVYYVILKNFKF